jgi:hypothetical protein
VRVAGELTYRQFVALAVVAHQDEHELELARMEALHQTGQYQADEGILLELGNLVDLRLLGISSDGQVGPLNNVFGGLVPRGKATYAQLGLLPGGEWLACMTRADEIATSERERWLVELMGHQSR